MATAEKGCTKCGTSKPLEGFYSDKRASDGRASSCKACHNLLTKRWKKENAEATLRHERKWRESNPEAVKRMRANWAAKNRGRLVAIQKKYALAHPNRINAKVSAWAKRNRAKLNARWSARRAAKLRATPSWADQAAIRAFYITADALSMLTGEWHNVDHIVPLRSPLVCGLHVPANLQVLSKAENLRKGNFIWPDMP